MAKHLLKIKAIALRKNGTSIKDIAKRLEVSQGIVSLWCRGINLSKEQITKLIKSKKSKITAGRLKGALAQKTKRLNYIEEMEVEARSLGKLSKNELFVSGLALYLAEGTKGYSTVQFTNKDPLVIKFMLRWFKEIYSIDVNDMKCSLIINSSHTHRDYEIRKFWSNCLGINKDRFTKTRFVLAKHKKIFDNPNEYRGTFNFRILKSSRLLYKINAYCSQLLKI
jgi:hypothetical protein